jgi:hypothetical protein
LLLGDVEFTEGQASGTYEVQWRIDSTPSESEAFNPGPYPTQVGNNHGFFSHFSSCV